MKVEKMIGFVQKNFGENRVTLYYDPQMQEWVSNYKGYENYGNTIEQCLDDMLVELIKTHKWSKEENMFVEIGG